MDSTKYKPEQIIWISDKGKKILITNLILANFIPILIVIIFILIAILNYSTRPKIMYASVFPSILYLFGIAFSYLYLSKIFNKPVKIIYGTLALFYGFIILGVLIFKEPIIEKKYIESNGVIEQNYDVGTKYKLLKRETLSEGMQHIGYNYETYWLTNKLFVLFKIFICYASFIVPILIGLDIYLICDIIINDASYLTNAPIIIPTFMIWSFSLICVGQCVSFLINKWSNPRILYGLGGMMLLTGAIPISILIFCQKIKYNTKEYELVLKS